ncbi:MAG: hypothetical protein QM817_37040 [Archangium sp.]
MFSRSTRALLVVVLGFVACHRTTRPSQEDDCRACLARGGTWQGSCTSNCELQDTFCYRTECLACSPQTCACQTAASCEQAGCRWNVEGEAMWCTQQPPAALASPPAVEVVEEVDAGPPPPRCDPLPAADANTVRWVSRDVGAGFYPGPYSVTTQTLDVGATSARLVVQKVRAPARSKGEDFTDERPVGPWRCESESTTSATVRKGPYVLRLRFEGAEEDSEDLQCVRRWMKVAPAGARLIRVPTRSEECKGSKWLTTRREELEVLSCQVPGTVGDPMFFARAPGVERVTFDEDCVTSLRVAAADGGILPGVRLSEQPDDLQRAFGPAR